MARGSGPFFQLAFPPGTPPGASTFFVAFTALNAFNGATASLADIAAARAVMVTVVP